MMVYHEQMDFYAFIDAVEFLLRKCFGEECEMSELEQMNCFVEKFRTAKKPLYYF